MNPNPYWQPRTNMRSTAAATHHEHGACQTVQGSEWRPGGHTHDGRYVQTGWVLPWRCVFARRLPPCPHCGATDQYGLATWKQPVNRITLAYIGLECWTCKRCFAIEPFPECADLGAVFDADLNDLTRVT